MSFIIDNLGLICSILSSLIAIASVIFGIVCKNTNTSKKLKGLAEVVKTFPALIRTAEKVSDKGEDKLAYVLELAILHCQAKGFEPTEEQLKDMVEQIEDQVKLSKDINQATKTQPSQPTQPAQPVNYFNRGI